MTTTPDLDRLEANLGMARATVAAEVPRTDTKASLLLAFDGAVIAGLLTIEHPLHGPARLFAGAALAALGVAAALLLLVVRPHISGADRASWPHWADLDEDGIRETLTRDVRPAQIRALSRITQRKMVGVRRAVDALLIALVLLATSAATAAL